MNRIPENKSFFLFGPRGTGKTTWVKTAFPGAVYLDLLEAGLYNDLLANPQRLSRFIPDRQDNWIIIDEIQKIPALLDEVHRLIETRRLRFILTGSSARKIKRKAPALNLLAGRALTLTMSPLTVQELGDDFDLSRSLQYGFLPAVYSEADPGAYLESYVKTYLQEEVLQEGLTRNLDAFYRFLEAASFSQGSTLNMSEISRECGVQRKNVENYFSILEDLLIADRVPVFSRKSKRRLVAHTKFYFFDVGVYRTLRPMGPLDNPAEAEGPALETLFYQQIKALNSCLNLGYTIHYWRTSNDIEVDFVLYGDQGLLAFEIKRTGTVQSKALRGLRSFLSDYPMCRAYFIYGGERRMYQDGIEIIPLEDALRELPSLLRGNSGTS
ncbi:MAG: ATP-binding protein [Candidatus Xenobiia bacterium LiM19]